MSKIGLVVLLSFLSGRTLSQDYRALSHDYFVFIGSDNRQPFYVRIDSQLYSSTPEGHLLLAPLKDTDYTMTIGFPGDIYPENQYPLSVRGKDREYGLRRQDDGSWRLYDVLGQHWVTALEKERRGDTVSPGIKKDDAFSRMMAGVVHDTAVLYNSYAMEQVLSDSPVASQKSLAPDSTMALLSDSALVARGTGSPVIRRDDTLIARRVDSTKAKPRATLVPGPGVVKLSEKKLSRSLRQVYTDNRDTVVVIIPRDTTSAALSAPGQVVGTFGAHSAGTPVARSSDTPGVRSADTPRGHSADTSRARSTDTSRVRSTDMARARSADSSRVRSTDKARAQSADTARSRSTDTASRLAKGIPYINSDCHSYATDYDVDRLRVKMLDAARDEDRIATARKVFKTKCFYTPQIRALSEVFTSDAGKYQFFEAAWPFSADEHFQELSVLLTDPVYLSKFRTMTGGRP